MENMEYKNAKYKVVYQYGYRIRKLRQKRGIKIEVILKTLNISRSALTGWETGRRYPNGQMLLKLAKLLGTTTDYLNGASEEEFPPTFNLSLLLGCSDISFKGEQLDNEKVDALKTIAKAFVR